MLNDNMLPETQHLYWTPDPKHLAMACEMAHGLVVDLCPGDYPLPHKGAKQIGFGFDNLDITRDSLPFDDQEVDFLYCRHTLEDLLDPFHAMREIARVAKSGWIETPSAISELARGVDGSRPPYRGYVHHRSLFWTEGDLLCTMPKYTLAEFCDLSHWNLPELLKSQKNWNTVHRWTGRLKGYQFRQEIDFHLADNTSYPAMLERALAKASANTAAEDR